MPAARIITTGLLASAAGSVVAIRRLNLETHKGSLLGAVQDEQCQDTDFGLTNAKGWGCDVYAKSMCNLFPHDNVGGFDPLKMCCVCGGGSRPESCPATCYEQTCNEWVSNGQGTTCHDLKHEYGCDCTGCDQCVLSDAPVFDNYWKQGLGLCEGPHQWFQWESYAQCHRRCNEDGDKCSGFAFSELDSSCRTYSSPVAASSGEPGAVCYVKGALEPPLSDLPSAETALVKDYAGEEQELRRSVPSEKEFEEPAANSHAAPSSDGKAATISAAGTTQGAQLGLVNAKVAQIFKPSSTGFILNHNKVLTLTSVSGASAMLYSTISAAFGTPGTAAARTYHLSKARLFGGMPSWRVTPENGSETLFSITKRRPDVCSEFGLKACVVWLVCKGKCSEKVVLYRGVQRSASFDFYRRSQDFVEHPDQDWLATLKPTEVTVKAGEDAALLLIAAHAIKLTGDLK